MLNLAFDTHSHFYPEYSVDGFMQSVFRNMKADFRLISIGNTASVECFELLKGSVADSAWEIFELDSMLFKVKSSRTKYEAYFVKSYQILSKERIEVIVFPGLMEYDSNLKSSKSLEEILAEVIESNGFAILPWSLGKWLGRRGEVLRTALNAYQDNLNKIFIGDVPQRRFDNTIESIKQRYRNIIILNGSDPLPLSKFEENNVGKMFLKLLVDESSSILGDQFSYDSVLSVFRGLGELKLDLENLGTRNSLKEFLFRSAVFKLRA